MNTERNKASAPPPWYVDVTYPDTFAFVEDRSLRNGMGMTVTLREVPLLEYDENKETQYRLGISLVR